MTPAQLAQLAAAERSAAAAVRHEVAVCTGGSCGSAGAAAVVEALAREAGAVGGGGNIRVKGVGCLGLCRQQRGGPPERVGVLVRVAPENHLYADITAEDAPRLVRSLGRAPLLERLVDTGQAFFTRQRRIVLETCGRVDPARIEDYIAAGGYAALLKALERPPTEVIAEVTRSGLRGRGGAGYPTGLKWSTVAKARGSEKYVVCNADEGDPGAFMDRTVLEGDPHRVLEGMAIAAWAVGARHGYIYCRAEYPQAIARLRTAIRQAEGHGLLGPAIADTPFGFRVEVRVGAGAFVCGEETALLASIEGGRGTPRPRPPYPAEHGLFGKPTLINNVETFANIPAIVREGGAWLAAIGTDKSKGTKVFSLAGHVVNTGVIEVPMGITLREIVFEIGGGIPNGRQCKAVQTGGPSGGCIPASHLDTPVDYESLVGLGSIMGSGGMIVMDDSTSMVEVARFFMGFSMKESCGKCVPCRVGTVHMHELLSRIAGGRGTARDLALLEELCDMVRQTSLCGLGMAAPSPVLSTLRWFRDEYEARLLAAAEG